MSVEKDKTNITVDMNSIDKNDGSAMWMFYHTTRSQWIKEKFAKEFPNEKDYRHSLREEAGALGVVATVVSESVKNGKMKERSRPVNSQLAQNPQRRSARSLRPAGET